MCGRYYLEVDIEDILSFYGIQNASREGYKKGEIFPGTNIPIVFKHGKRKLDYFRWGFKISTLNKEVINARLETIEEKSTFKKAYFENRCIIPANSFFEWKTEFKNKTRYKISTVNTPIFSMAGIYNSFIDKEGNIFTGVVILTKPANKEMSKLHHRMPVFIEKEEEEDWLSKDKVSEVFKKKLMDFDAPLKISEDDGIKQISILDLM